MNLGTKFERLFAKLYNLKKVRASGALPFWKLDVEGQDILCELKATQKESFRVTKDILDKTSEAIYGPGGIGGDCIPAVVICLVEGDEPAASDKVYFIFEESDIIHAFKDKKEFFPSSKGEQKLQTSQTPGLFRQEP
jgi:hypothetical protein